MIVERYKRIPISIVSGMRADLESNKQELAQVLLSKDNCRGFNLLPENVLDQVMSVLEKRKVRFQGLKKDFGISRSLILLYFASFSDFHNLRDVEQLSEFARKSIEVIENIEKESRSKNSPLDLVKQLEIALESCDNNLVEAVLALAIGTRAMARGADSRILPNYPINKERIKNWKTCLKAFGWNDDLQDPAGDTYHFWNCVLAGISSNEKVDPWLVRLFKQGICEIIYKNTSLATEVLRYKICGKKGKIHPEVDYLGYEIGKALIYLSEEKTT